MRVVLSVVVVLGLCLAACGDDVDEAEAIHGTWSIPIGVWVGYETFYPDGTWDVYENDDPVHDWGTYTLEDGILTMTNADDSYCPGSAVVFEVTFSEDGNELEEKFVSDSCTKPGVARGQDRVLTRHTP